MPLQASTNQRSNVTLSCLICYKTISPLYDTVLKNSAHILSDLFKLFCKFMKLEPRLSSPTISSIRRDYSFDFTKEQFPFCDPCKSGLANLFELNEQLEAIQKQIDSVTSKFTAQAIESCGLEQRRDRKYDKEFSKLGKRDANVLLDQNTRRKVLGLRRLIRGSYQVKVLLSRTLENNSPIYKNAEHTLPENTRSPGFYLFCPDTPNILTPLSGDVGGVGVSRTATSHNADESVPAFDSFHDNNGIVEIDIDTEISTADASRNSDSKSADEDEAEFEEQVATGGYSFSDVSYKISDAEKNNDDEHEKVGRSSKRIQRTTKCNVKFRSSSSIVVEESPGKYLYADKFYFEKIHDLFQCKECSTSYDSREKCVTHIRNKHLNPLRFNCETCGKSFARNGSLQSHLRLHKVQLQRDEIRKSIEDPDTRSSLTYKCNKCGKPFKTSSSYYFHKTRQNCANDYEYQCDEPGCGKMLYSSTLLEEHKRVHKRTYKCHICSKSFGYEKGLIHHIKIHSGTQYHFCPEEECEEKFRRLYLLQEHMESVHEKSLPKKSVAENKSNRGTRVVCEACGKTVNKSGLLRHQQALQCTRREISKSLSSSKTLPYTCSKCCRSFKRSSSLLFDKTRQNCNNDYEYECDEPDCGKMLFSPALLEEHKRAHNREHKCHICSKAFGYERVLKQHLKIHDQTHYYFCSEEECNQKFRRRFHLKEHMESVHHIILPENPAGDENSGQSQCICEACGKTVQKSGLRKHRKTHEATSALTGKGEERQNQESSSPLPFACPKCDKTFKSSHALKFHRTHHNCVNDYEYQCEEPGCGKMMYSPTLLDEHKKVHSRPHKCHICSKAFGYEKGLVHHLKVHSGTQYHSCPDVECGQKFRRRYQLEDHMISVHQTNLPERIVVRSVPSGSRRASRTPRTRVRQNKFTCNDCDKSFKTKKLLNVHSCLSNTLC